jgi:hypothetical protein
MMVISWKKATSVIQRVLTYKWSTSDTEQQIFAAIIAANVKIYSILYQIQCAIIFYIFYQFYTSLIESKLHKDNKYCNVLRKGTE